MEKYNAAIDLNPEVPTYYCNRAFCHTRMENHGLAIEDAGAETGVEKTGLAAPAAAPAGPARCFRKRRPRLYGPQSGLRSVEVRGGLVSSPRAAPRMATSHMPTAAAGVALELDKQCAKGYYRRGRRVKRDGRGGRHCAGRLVAAPKAARPATGGLGWVPTHA